MSDLDRVKAKVEELRRKKYEVMVKAKDRYLISAEAVRKKAEAHFPYWLQIVEKAIDQKILKLEITACSEKSFWGDDQFTWKYTDPKGLNGWKDINSFLPADLRKYFDKFDTSPPLRDPIGNEITVLDLGRMFSREVHWPYDYASIYFWKLTQMMASIPTSAPITVTTSFDDYYRDQIVMNLSGMNQPL